MDYYFQMNGVGKMAVPMPPFFSEDCLPSFSSTFCFLRSVGKTTVALAVASHLGRKTLVLVHKRFLADQWKERITTFLPTASVSLYGCGAADPTGDVVVATIQTILSKGFPAHYAADIGTVIVDEVHRIAAPSFSKALFAGLNAPFLLGLSATPERADKLTKVIHWLCGPLVYSHQLQTATASTVHIVTYKEPCDIPLNRRGDVDHASLITQLAENDARTAFLLDAMDRLVLTPHTHCLILSHRRAHCMVLAECLRLRGYDAATYLGGDTQIPPSNILVSTYALVSEGFDQPRLTTLVLATPASNVTQAVGRILRGGSHGTILDLVDANPVSYAQASKRRKYYTASGFRVVSNGASEPNNAYMFREEPKKSVSI